MSHVASPTTAGLDLRRFRAGESVRHMSGWVGKIVDVEERNGRQRTVLVQAPHQAAPLRLLPGLLESVPPGSVATCLATTAKWCSTCLGAAYAEVPA